ncbi:MAG: hypothetical protein Q9217_004635 [Psora testacea]
MACNGKVADDRRRHMEGQSPEDSLLQRSRRHKQDQRRLSFLRSVRQASDNKRWEARGNQILRQEYIEQQRRWRREQDTSAPEAHPTSDDDDPERQDFTCLGDQHTDIVDRLVSQEDQEFEALISIMEDQRTESGYRPQTQIECSSDDEEYDRLFTEVLEGDSSGLRVWMTRASGQAGEQEMDMSSG